MNLRPLRLLVPLAVVASLSAAADARAGDLALHDDAHVLTPAEADALKQVVAKAPFDARLVTTTTYPDQAALSRFVGSLVAEGDMVVVGIDPQHRHVQVHFGTQSHIPAAAWPSIERAGNDAFKRGAWEEGAAAIFQSAEESVSASGSPATVPAVTPRSSSGGFIGPIVLLLIVGGVFVAIAMVMRRRMQGNAGGGYGAPSPYGSGPYYGPGNRPGGMGALGGGILGAGLGGIAGYELGKMEGERERGRDGGGFDASGAGSSDGGSFDAGGGGSSWGDSGSNDGGGGGFDGGGDSGGGSDF
jgi:hypothetical protein